MELSHSPKIFFLFFTQQGGYPWTHLYKGPLGPDEEPEVILNYKYSPRGQRRHSGDHETPKSQKKVRIQDEIEVQETQNYIQDLSENETNENEPNDENLDPTGEEEEEETEPTAEAKSPKSILKGSQKAAEDVVEEASPTASKSDTGSLKKKFKNPLQRIKKMADQQFKRVKSNRPFIKKIHVSKDEIILSDEVKILKLKESPKSQHREIPAYVEKRDSEDSVEIINLDESPMESRKRRENETHVVTPDEIIELPQAEAEAVEEVKSEQREGTVESHKTSISEKSSSPAQELKQSAPKKRDHVYEDIDEYISKITSDSENVDFAPFQQEAKLEEQEKIAENDPIFEEFSREMNKQIRRSLSIQDDSIRHELVKRIPKIEELEKQISDEDKEEKVDQIIRQAHLLAPISSIDSTSSDESRRQLSIVNEESDASDSNKKKSFDDSSVEREVESLKTDGSDISTTLIEDELKGLDDAPKVDQGKESAEAKSDEQVNSTALKETVEKPEETDQQVAEDAAVKEDVVVKSDADASIKVNKRWSKMRFVSFCRDVLDTNASTVCILCDIFRHITNRLIFRKYFKQRKTFKGDSQLRACLNCFAVWR